MLQRVARDVFRHRDHRVGARLAALDEALPMPLLAMNGRCRVAIHLTSSRRASARATQAVAGERAWTSDDVGRRAGWRRARAGSVRRAHSGWRTLGQLEMRGAQAQQVGHHAAAGRGDDGRAAGGDHGLRGVERGARQAAAGEGRHDLQEGAEGHVAWRRVCGVAGNTP